MTRESGIGARLEQIRQSSGTSQADFAASLGISRTTLHNYAREERDLPAAVLAKLLELYRADPLWVLDGEAGIQNREGEIMQELGLIFEAVERRVVERDLRLSAKKRWMIVCRLYSERIAALRQTGEKPSLEALRLDSLLDMAA